MKSLEQKEQEYTYRIQLMRLFQRKAESFTTDEQIMNLFADFKTSREKELLVAASLVTLLSGKIKLHKINRSK